MKIQLCEEFQSVLVIPTDQESPDFSTLKPPAKQSCFFHGGLLCKVLSAWGNKANGMALPALPTHRAGETGPGEWEQQESGLKSATY